MTAGGVGLVASPVLGVEDAAPVVALKTPAFKIPYSIDSRGKRPAKVQLWVSVDQGENWQLHGTKSLDTKLFDFRAAAEGEYWFLVQSVDENGTAYPSAAKPMRVLVDTTKPTAEIEADYSVDGDLIVDLSVAEPHLALDTAILRYRTDQDEQWHDVELNLASPEDGRLADTIKIPVPACREIGLVFQIQDQAGNAGQATYKYEVPRTAGIKPDLTLASTGDQQGKFVSIPGATSWEPVSDHTKRKLAARKKAAQPKNESFQVERVESSESVEAERTFGAQRAAVAQHGVRSSTSPQNPGRLAGNAAPASSLPGTALPATAPSANVPSAYGGTSAYGGGLMLEPSAPPVEELPAPQPESRPQESLPPESPQTLSRTSTEPSRGELPQYTSTYGGAPGAGSNANRSPDPRLELDSPQQTEAYGADAMRARQGTSSLPQGVAIDAPRAAASVDAFKCNSRAFSLDYSVESLGGSSLSTVQLWGTEDEGVSWQQWGEDPDRVSPFDVKVGNDGLFGFRMVVISANGLVSNKPRPGDKADVWIQVDTSVPTVQISRAVYGIGQLEGKLVVDFSCTDNQLLRQPAALYFRTNKAEKWQLIEQNLEANDTYAWQPPLDLPDHIYLMVQAVDQAGNIGQHELDKPINVKGLAPRGRIHRVRPIR